MEADGSMDAQVIEVLLGSKNQLHNNYQDFQDFMDEGGRIGLQHDPLLYGAYLLNPFLVRVELVPMLVVKQGEVAVIKSFVGPAHPRHLGRASSSSARSSVPATAASGRSRCARASTRSTLGVTRPRSCPRQHPHPELGQPQCRQAHNLDAHLSPIEGKSREGFVFTIDLQVQIHVPDTKAPKVISMVGTMLNLVNEVLQSAVGNHFRNTLQRSGGHQLHRDPHAVQRSALEAITGYLAAYEVETQGVYIQDVEFPAELVKVLTQREIAKQEKATFEEQQRAQTARIEIEKAKRHRRHAGPARTVRR